MPTCVKPYSKADGKYTKKNSVLSPKTSPYTKRDSVLTKMDSKYSEQCLDYTAKLFQDGAPFVFQDGSQYIFE